MKPRRETLYPTLDEALFVHERLIEGFGGVAGVLDLGLLEAALVRPRSGFYETLSMQAAALMQSLACNHAFVDGNKRVAFALTAVFLRTNGYRLVVDADTAERFIIDEVIVGHAGLETISTWLELYMTEAAPLR